MVSTVGRPKEHDARTGEALLDAAELLVEEQGMAMLSVRRVAESAGTTTRAVYAVFGSKEGLVVALGRRAFEWLADAVDEVPSSDDPITDLAECGIRVFRRLVVEHPALFKIGVQRSEVPAELVPRFRTEADNAMARLQSRFERLREHGLLDDRSISEAALQFHALCEGLAAIELRAAHTAGLEERIWRDALTALIAGFSSPEPSAPRSSTRRHVRASR